MSQYRFIRFQGSGERIAGERVSAVVEMDGARYFFMRICPQGQETYGTQGGEIGRASCRERV